MWLSLVAVGALVLIAGIAWLIDFAIFREETGEKRRKRNAEHDRKPREQWENDLY
ncbi:hypothetical protein [Herbaspirillum autotrophicum]|uniref:hypothetical protein n=1 Tax=Herbaspirillum autotrophicum TaxID=180195 RepID=UPI000AB70315|nr:hypothetical protein [Herbaspirillum autotrophicum]